MDAVWQGSGTRHGPPLRARIRLAAVRLATRDPGLVALRRGARGVLSFGLTLLVVEAISAITGQSIMAMSLGFSISIFGATIPREAEQRARLESTLALFAAAGVSFCLSALLTHVWLNHAVFVGLVFLVVYARRFGERANAAGFGAFTSFFLAAFLAPPPQALPWQLLGLVLAALVVMTVQLVVLPQRAAESFARSRRVLARRLWRVLGALGAVGASRSERAWSLFEHELMAFERGIDAARAQLDAVAVGSPTRNAISFALFELETAAERVARLGARALGRDLAWEGLPGAREPRATLPPASSGGARGLGPDEMARLRALESELAAEASVTEHALPVAAEALGDALDELRDSVRRLRSLSLEAFVGVPSAPPPTASFRASEPASEAAAHDGVVLPREPALPRAMELRPEPGAAISLQTRLAIQASAACALAILGGEWLSPQRWYWAVIAVWAMFSGTASRGDALYKSLQRLLGTVLGVLVGMGLVALVGRDPSALFVLMLVSIFATYYFFTDALVLMTFFLTVMLAVLFALLGRFSTQLLWLRLEETVVGAAAGIVVAALVYPRATEEHVRERFDELVIALEALIDASLERLAQGEGGPRGEQTRALVRAEDALRVALRPWTLARFDVGASLHGLITTQLEICMRALHELSAAGGARHAAVDPPCRRSLEHQRRRFAARLRCLCQDAEADSVPHEPDECRDPVVERAARALDHMANALARIATALHRISSRSPLVRF